MTEKLSSEQNVAEAFEIAEGALEDLRRALSREFALGTLLMAGEALASVRSSRQVYAEFHELERLLTD